MHAAKAAEQDSVLFPCFTIKVHLFSPGVHQNFSKIQKSKRPNTYISILKPLFVTVKHTKIYPSAYNAKKISLSTQKKLETSSN